MHNHIHKVSDLTVCMYRYRYMYINIYGYLLFQGTPVCSKIQTLALCAIMKADMTGWFAPTHQQC